MRQLSFRQIGLTVFLFFMLLTGCDCGKPTEPEPIVKEYKVYFADRSGSQKLYIYSPLKSQLDSTVLPFSTIRSLTVSPDGKLLFVQSDNIKILETDSFTIVDEISINGLHRSIISSDNKYLAMTGDTLYIVRLSDKQIVYSDFSHKTYGGYFSSNNQSFYCTAQDTTITEFRFVHKLDLTTTPFTKTNKIFDNQYINTINVSPDEQKWYLTNGFAFEVYDVTTDSIIFVRGLCPALINTEISLNNNYVYITDPGNFDCYLLPHILIYDIESNQLLSEKSEIIDSIYSAEDTIVYQSIFEIALTPDNKFLAILSGPWANQLGGFHVINLQDATLDYREIYWDLQYRFTNLTVQQNL